MNVLQRAAVFGRMIRFSHSVFAMPFALASAALAAPADFRWSHLGWIVLAMVSARSAAMGFNRLADHAIDARNPRTAARELPRGALSRREVWAFVAASALVFLLAAAMLNPLCLALAPVALAVILGYSYTKRFTALSHVVLGLALAIAPVGAWIAVRGRLDAAPLALAVAVVAWVAGFDVIYSCQDVAFDRAQGLYSLPARLGVAGALRVSRGLHGIAVVALAGVFPLVRIHPTYLAGVVLVAALLAYEHSLVRADDLSRVDAAFFAVNGWVGVGFLLVTLAAVALGAPTPALE